jgi:hypothetical protein
MDGGITFPTNHPSFRAQIGQRKESSTRWAATGSNAAPAQECESRDATAYSIVLARLRWRSDESLPRSQELEFYAERRLVSIPRVIVTFCAQKWRKQLKAPNKDEEMLRARRRPPPNSKTDERAAMTPAPKWNICG